MMVVMTYSFREFLHQNFNDDDYDDDDDDNSSNNSILGVIILSCT